LSLVAIHAVMSQKFGFACNNGDVPGILGRGDRQAANVPIRIIFDMGSSRAATSLCDEIHCGQCGKYLKNQSLKHLLAGDRSARFLGIRA